MNNMGIKQGDEVRVSKDAPKMYLRGQAYFFKEEDCKVDMVEDNNAVITNGPRIIAIPCKYLVKVNAEAKEAKYHKGDRVRHIKNDEYGIVLNVEADGVYVGVAYSLQKRFWKNREIEPVQPKKQTEAEKTYDDQIRDVLNGVEHQDYGHPIHTAMINLDINDWDAYAADIAKEVALKVANKYNDPNKPQSMPSRLPKRLWRD
jgi:hypothetical protein|nr:MAG TPA: hypothetical protein [Caudoviricetes sp.]